MANLSNINNKFLVTTGGNVLIGQTSAVGSSIFQVTGNSTFAGTVTVGRNLDLSSSDYTYIQGTHTGAGDGEYVMRTFGYGDSTFYGSFDILKHDTDDGELRLRQRIAGTATDVLSIVDGNSTFAGGTIIKGNGVVYLGYTDASAIGGNKLEVNGNIYGSGNATFAGNVRISKTDATLEINNSTGSLTNADLYISVEDTGQADVRQYGAYPLAFWTNNTERMRIDSSGNVGIGGTPSTFANFTNVTIQGGSSGSNLDFKNSSGTRVSAIVTTASNELIIETGTAQPMIFKTNDTERMRIDSSGYVGIGVSNPSDYYAKNLVVTGPVEGGITIASTGNHTNYLLFADSSSGVARYAGMVGYAHDTDLMSFRTNSIQRMAIDSSGNVGITAAAYLGFNGAGDASHSVGYNSGIDGAILRGQNGVILGTGGGATASERMRITSAGDVGIGTTSPQGKLDSVAPVADLTDFGRATGSALNIRIANVVNRLGQINFCNDAAPAFGYGSIGMVMTSGSGVGLGDMVFGTKGSGSAVVSTERMRITSGGNVAIGGTLGADSQFRVELKPAATILAGLRIGYNSTSNNYYDADTHHFRLGTGSIAGGNLMVGGGIYLGGTAAANKLDDYEEGTWTGTMANDGVGNTTTGSYTKIGNRVFFEIYFAGRSVTNAGTADVTGFPFTADTNAGYGGAWYWHGNATNQTVGGAYNTGTMTRLVQLNSTGIATWKIATVWIMLAGCYKTTS